MGAPTVSYFSIEENVWYFFYDSILGVLIIFTVAWF